MSTNATFKKMTAQEYLKEYKKRFQPFLKEYFETKIKEAKKNHSLTEEALRIIADFTFAGGKRIRPALVYYGYLAVGGKDDDEIVKTSMSIELVHSFLLIHDDIIDRDEKRHGTETVHERYRKIAQKYFPSKDTWHFGVSMAIIAGDLTASMASEIIFNSNFPPQTIIRALDKLQQIVYVTIPGEMLDVYLGFQGKSTEEEILLMHEGKTARYTFEGPLHLGAVLAGAKDETLKYFSEYAVPVGQAFQIRDDVLGVFGDEKKLGKPVGSDIIEGKQTLLLIKALEKASSAEKKFLQGVIGKETLTKEELEKFRAIIKETGSLDYSEKLAQKLVEQSIVALEKIDFKNKKAKDFLFKIAQYIIQREV